MIFWITFYDPGAPEGENLLGAMVMEGDDIDSALDEAGYMGIASSGVIDSFVVDETNTSDFIKGILAFPRNRFMTLQELNTRGFFTLKQRRAMS